MEIRKVKITDLTPADYNPRQDLKPEDREYKKIERSLEEFGYVEPIVWNEATGNVVGGHQRLKMLIAAGETETTVSVVNLSDHDEKILNVALNRIVGRWDNTKLKDILSELQEQGELDLTGFEEWELEALNMEYDHITDLLNEDFSEFATRQEKETFAVTFTLPAEEEQAVKDYIAKTKDAKIELATAVINKIKGVL